MRKRERERGGESGSRATEKRAGKKGKGKKRRYGIRVATREKGARGLPFDLANARVYSEVIPTKV